MITAIGDNVAGNLQSLQQQRSGLTQTKYLNTIYKEVLPVAEIGHASSSLATMAGIEDIAGYTRTSLLGIIAMQEAIRQAGLTSEDCADSGLVNATTVGGMCDTEQVYFDIIDPQKNGDFIKYIDTLDCADCTLSIAKHIGINGPVTTISTACSSSANALLFGARLIKQGLAQRVICGGTEALTRFTLNGFNSLKNIDKQPCRPFDNTRNGLNLGEGAAFLVLESASLAASRKANILAELAGYCNTNEAFHPTAPSPNGDGAYQAMKGAIEMAGKSPADIQYVNVHGTATLSNDLSEGNALQRLFGTTVPAFSSTKPFTGHTLAAAGAIEAIYAVLAIRQHSIWPNLHFTTQMEELSISPETRLLEQVSVNNVISNSFGFGGNNASLLISKYEG